MSVDELTSTSAIRPGPLLPGDLEFDAADAGQQVDTIGFNSKLDHVVLSQKILSRNARGAETKRLNDRTIRSALAASRRRKMSKSPV